MARYEEIVDFWWTHDGDLRLGDDGDLKDTSLSAYRGFLQEVVTSVLGTKGDWKSHPEVGANMMTFVGKPNTRATANEIEAAIRSELAVGDLMRGNELAVNVVPIADTAIAIFLVINPPRTSGQVVLTFTYDMRDNKMIPRNI